MLENILKGMILLGFVIIGVLLLVITHIAIYDMYVVKNICGIIIFGSLALIFDSGILLGVKYFIEENTYEFIYYKNLIVGYFKSIKSKLWK